MDVKGGTSHKTGSQKPVIRPGLAACYGANKRY